MAQPNDSSGTVTQQMDYVKNFQVRCGMEEDTCSSTLEFTQEWIYIF